MKTNDIKEIKEILSWKIPRNKQHFVEIVGYDINKITKEKFVNILKTEEKFSFECEIDEHELMCYFKAEREHTEDEIKEIEAKEEAAEEAAKLEAIEKAAEKVYMDELNPVDSLFHCEVVSHGVAAFNGKHTKEEIITGLKDIIECCGIEMMQLCASHKTQHIGAVGIYVMGYVHCVSNFDLWSHRSYDGGKSRYIDVDCLDKLIYTKEDIDLTKWSHMEYILTPRKIVGLWYKEEVSEALLQELNEIAKDLGIKMYKVK